MSTTTKTLRQLASKMGIQCRFGAKLPRDKQDDWQRKATGWDCTLCYREREFTFDFWQGSAIKGEPTVIGTLECLLSDSQADDQSFEEFCSEFGYDTDSRKAEQTWQACKKSAVGLKRLLGDDYEAFLYAERE